MDEESLSIAQSTPYRAPEKRTRDGTTSSPDSHRPKLELTIEITRPNDVEDDDELLDPLPTEDFEIPDSESDFGDETLSVDSKQSFDPLDPPEEFFVNQYEDGWY